MPPLSTEENASSLDRMMAAHLGRFTFGLSPAALALAYLDWLVHLAFAPGKNSRLVEKSLRKMLVFALYARQVATDPKTPPCIEPLPQDRRFAGEDWQRWPFNLHYQASLLMQQWWHNATTGIQGMSYRSEDVISFAGRQVLDMFAPSNMPLTNPEVLKATLNSMTDRYLFTEGGAVASSARLPRPTLTRTRT